MWSAGSWLRAPSCRESPRGLACPLDFAGPVVKWGWNLDFGHNLDDGFLRGPTSPLFLASLQPRDVPRILVGLLLVIGGLFAVVYFIGVLDTSVPVGDCGERVNKIGLMRDQQNGITGGVLAAVVGGVLLFIAYSRDELGDIIKKGLAADERKCPAPRERAQSSLLRASHRSPDRRRAVSGSPTRSPRKVTQPRAASRALETGPNLTRHHPASTGRRARR